MIIVGPSLTGLRGTQVTGSIIYTLVRLCYEPGLKGALAPIRAARMSQETRRALAPVCKAPLASI
jgi:hypothetical protein